MMISLILLFSLVSQYTLAAPGWRVINGQETIQNEYPSIISFQLSYGGHFCGGTLIDSTTVITAAHCVFPFRSYPVSYLKVRAGEHNFDVSDSPP